MDEKAKEFRKKKLQFLRYRDVGEGIDIKSLPATLIEAAKELLKKKKPDKITLTHAPDSKYVHSHVNLKPKYKI